MADSENRSGHTEESVVEQSNTKKRDSASVKKIQHKKFKTPQQWKILLAAYEKDSSSVFAGTRRAQELMDATGLELPDVQFWFYSRRSTLKNGTSRGVEKTPEQLEVLLAAYAEDPKPPQRDSERMQKLITATNLESVRIRQWFWDRVKRARKNGVQIDFGEDACKDETDFNLDRVGKCCWKTPEQMEILLAAYAEDPSAPKIDTARAKQLCASTGIDFKDIRDWFGVRRRKLERLGNREERKHPMKKVKRPEQLKALKEAYAKDPSRVYRDTERTNELIATTRLSLAEIQNWFNRMQRNVVGESTIRDRKTPEQLKLLIAAYEQNPGVRSLQNGRLEQLSAETGLKPELIRRWYQHHRGQIRKGTRSSELVAKLEKRTKQQEILNEAFDKDSSSPALRSDRLNELCAATGLRDRYIKEWFKQQKVIRRARERKKLQDESEGVSSQNEDPNEVLTENSVGDISNSESTKEDRSLKKSNNKKGLSKSTPQRGKKIVKKTGAPRKKKTAKPDSVRAEDDDCVIIEVSQIVTTSNSDRNLEQENTVPTSKNVKKCPICDAVCSAQAVAIVSLKEPAVIVKHLQLAIFSPTRVLYAFAWRISMTIGLASVLRSTNEYFNQNLLINSLIFFIDE